jgi:hypothetical protein
MRTVLTHFYNEEYLLPWWLEHHVRLFDHGVLIDHGSTDASADLCRQIAPHWRLVRSRLTHFDAYLTDFELMGYEQELPGWKMALTVTEFLLPARPLAEFERKLERAGRMGGAASGFQLVDHEPAREPSPELPLLLQKTHGIDDNDGLSPQVRVGMGLAAAASHNRAYHRLPVGMYTPGRHGSFHPDNTQRHSDLVVAHLSFAPWNERFLQRKLQIAAKVPVNDLKHSRGAHHLRTRAQWDAFHQACLRRATDLRAHPVAGPALAWLEHSQPSSPLT